MVDLVTNSPEKGKAAYTALLTGGMSGVNAVLGGNRSVDGKYERLEAHGICWTASENDPTTAPSISSARRSSVLAGPSERAATAAIVACLAEMDARRLYLGEGCRSLFAYCTQVLHLSEHAAYARIEAARAVRGFPVILERLSGGEIALTAIGLLRPHLTEANHLDILDRARFKLKRDVEELVASLAPKPDVPAMVRKLPEPPMPQPTL